MLLTVLKIASFAMLNVNTLKLARLEDMRKPETKVEQPFPFRMKKQKPSWVQRHK
jgi:hypothetical protein